MALKRGGGCVPALFHMVRRATNERPQVTGLSRRIFWAPAFFVRSAVSVTKIRRYAIEGQILPGQRLASAFSRPDASPLTAKGLPPPTAREVASSIDAA